MVGRAHHPRTRRNPSLRIQNIMSRQGGEFRIAPGSSNNRRTRKSLRRANRNPNCPPQDGGLETGAGGHKEVGTRGGPDSINRNGESQPDGDGGGTVVSHTRENRGAITGNSMSQPEDDQLRMAPNNHNFAHTQASPCLADKNAGGHPEDDGLRVAGSGSHVIQHWENPDSAGGRAVSDPWKDSEPEELFEDEEEESPPQSRETLGLQDHTPPWEGRCSS